MHGEDRVCMTHVRTLMLPLSQTVPEANAVEVGGGAGAPSGGGPPLAASADALDATRRRTRGTSRATATISRSSTAAATMPAMAAADRRPPPPPLPPPGPSESISPAVRAAARSWLAAGWGKSRRATGPAWAGNAAWTGSVTFCSCTHRALAPCLVLRFVSTHGVAMHVPRHSAALLPRWP